MNSKLILGFVFVVAVGALVIIAGHSTRPTGRSLSAHAGARSSEGGSSRYVEEAPQRRTGTDGDDFEPHDGASIILSQGNNNDAVSTRQNYTIVKKKSRVVPPFKLPVNSKKWPWIPGYTNATKGVMRIDGKDYKWEVVSAIRPRAFLVHAMVTHEEADAIREAAAPDIARSTVIDLTEGQAKSKVDPWRTSHGMFMMSPEQEALKANRDYRRRVTIFAGLDESWIEKTQVLNYQPGQYYKAHEDYFAPNDEVNLARGGQRVVTSVLYLNQVKSGGETYFPKEAHGLKARPDKGDAFFFYDVDEDGELDPFSLHEGRPPGPGSEKWIAVLWCHPRPFY